MRAEDSDVGDIYCRASKPSNFSSRWALTGSCISWWVWA